MVKEIKIEDFNYSLPDERIARHPLEQRDKCRLLVSTPSGNLSSHIFNQLPNILPVGSFLVCNDTKVINARIEFFKETGSKIEIFLLEPVFPYDYNQIFQAREKCIWHCLVGNLKKWKEGTELHLSFILKNRNTKITLTAKRLTSSNPIGEDIEFTWEAPDVDFAEILETCGNIPIPPYLKRDSEESDIHDYQTVYADAKGSVAAPTAGLHFTQAVFDDLKAHNISVGKITLHVGAGTFRPVKSETIGGHDMHTETFTITKKFLAELIDKKTSGKPIVAVGTTTVRTLESLPYLGLHILKGSEDLHVTQWEAYEAANREFDTLGVLSLLLDYMDRLKIESLTASTAIMLAPGFNWRMTDAIITNFHQPQSTLLLLVSSFLRSCENKPQWRKIYDKALNENYRFLSYGDACLLFPLSHKI